MASVGLPPEPKPSVIPTQQLLQRDRAFRDLLTNPPVDALVSHVIQGGFPVEFPFRMRRFDNSMSYLKWRSTPPTGGQTGFSRPGSITLHPDDRGCPMPWGGSVRHVNATWMLTAYGFYRHFSLSPQENLQVTIPDGMGENCAEPTRLREMLGSIVRFTSLTSLASLASLATTYDNSDP